MRESSISNQKRLVRKMHWELARKALRARDKVHHRAWRLLTIAGPAPHEEIDCIRSMMHQAHITSVDIDPANLERAIEAGADEVFQLDVGAFVETSKPQLYSKPYVHYDPPPQLVGQPFDVICLDLTGPADDWLKRVVQVYFRNGKQGSREGMIAAGGAMILTFSYGRDVVEVYDDAWPGADKEEAGALENVPTPIASRVWYVLRKYTPNVESCLQYRGGMMPMVSCLLRKGLKFNCCTFESIGGGDYEIAISYEEIARQYACPAERVRELRAHDRRCLAAQKAVETRRLRENKQPRLRVVQPSDDVMNLPPPPALSPLAQMEKLWRECTDEQRAGLWDILHKIYEERSLEENSKSLDGRARGRFLGLLASFARDSHG